METEYYFNRLRADNMELFYEHNFNFWFVHNSSHTKFNEELLTGAMKDVRAVTNALGFREDKITTSKIDVSGFKIKESEFIEYEKDKILSLLKDSTNSQLKRKLNHYLEFIQKKESQFETSQPHQVEEKLSNKNTIIEPPAQYFKDLFTDENLYNKVIDILIGENYIEKGTLIWKDEKKGNKQFIVGLIKSLHFKNFFDNKPHYNEIVLICKNTFKVEISKSTIDKTNKDTYNYDFIPNSNDLK